MSKVATKPHRAATGYGGFKTKNEEAGKSEAARAWRAVEAARHLAPTFKAFVKAVSGKDVQVIINPARTATDGKVLLVQPPIELGDPGANRHALGLCHEYASDGLSLCGACRIQESMLARVYHEIAHTLFGSMDEPTPEDIRYAAQKAGERTSALLAIATPDLHAEFDSAHWAERFERAMYRDEDKGKRTASFMGVASVVSEWLPLLVNLIEDMRVNERLFVYQPGMRRVLGGDIKLGVTEVLEGQHSGTKEFDPEFVAALAMYADAMGWQDLWRTRTDDASLIALIEHPEVQNLLEQGRVAASVGESFRIANDLLAVSQGLGFFLDPEPPEEEESKEDKEDDESDGKPGEGSGSGGKGKSGEAGSDSSDGDSSDASATGGPKGSNPGKRANGGDDADSDDGDDDSGDDPDGDSDSDSDSDSGDAGDEGDGDPTDGDAGKADSAPKDAESEAERAKGVARELLKILGHDDGDMGADGLAEKIAQALVEIDTDSSPLGLAIGQAAWFKGPSRNIAGVNVTRLGEPGTKSGRGESMNRVYAKSLAGEFNRGSYMFVNGPAGQLANQVAAREAGKARLVFAANRAVKTTRNKDHGKIYAPTLGPKMRTGDFKVFGTKERPDKRDYAVLVGMDISGSTGSGYGDETLNELIRQCGYTQMELLNRIGVGHTSCYAHTGESFENGLNVSLYEVKSWTDQWDRKAKARIDALRPASANLDGHTFEAYLKILHKVQATDKILLYFTDGAMPAENHDEELRILQKTFQRTKRMSNLHILTVGVQNDDPLQYGLDMVRLDKAEDIGRVTTALAGMIK